MYLMSMGLSLSSRTGISISCDMLLIPGHVFYFRLGTLPGCSACLSQEKGWHACRLQLEHQNVIMLSDHATSLLEAFEDCLRPLKRGRKCIGM